MLIIRRNILFFVLTCDLFPSMNISIVIPPVIQHVRVSLQAGSKSGSRFFLHFLFSSPNRVEFKLNWILNYNILLTAQMKTILIETDSQMKLKTMSTFHISRMPFRWKLNKRSQPWKINQKYFGTWANRSTQNSL